jgi:hypothetical protein
MTASLALVAFAPREAAAFERQWHAGADLGLSFFGDNPGLGGGGHLTYGLTDAFNALLEVDATRHGVGFLGGGDEHATVLSGAAGVAYTLDITQWVPYFGLLVGGYRLINVAVPALPVTDPPKPDNHVSVTALGGQVVLGLDYQLERSWALGVQLRYHEIFAADPVGSRSYTTTFLRAEYVWGF